MEGGAPRPKVTQACSDVKVSAGHAAVLWKVSKEGVTFPASCLPEGAVGRLHRSGDMGAFTD